MALPSLLMAMALAGAAAAFGFLLRLRRETTRVTGLRDHIAAELARVAPAGPSSNDWYAVLHVPETASPAEIEAAYDRLAAAARTRARRHGQALNLARLKQARSKALAAIAG